MSFVKAHIYNTVECPKYLQATAVGLFVKLPFCMKSAHIALAMKLASIPVSFFYLCFTCFELNCLLKGDRLDTNKLYERGFNSASPEAYYKGLISSIICVHRRFFFSSLSGTKW